MDHPPLQVKVVSADREVWKGESVNIIVRTTAVSYTHLTLPTM